MAKIFYELKKNNNQNSPSFCLWYARTKTVETINTRGLSQHISEHGSIYTSDVVFGVLEKFRSCLIEMLLESKRVKIDGLGTFYCTIEGKGAPTEEDFNVATHVKGLHIRFMPEQVQEMDISSRQFLKKAKVMNIKQLSALPKTEQEEPENGNGNENLEP
jgi:predicted histone-like DNA-binding protein